MILWGILALILVGIGLALGAPFLDFLAPNEHIWLVDLTDQKNPSLLANGAETLWYQWQTWLYIAIFCFILVLIFSIISRFIQGYVDQELSEKKQRLDKQIEELKESKSNFECKKTEEIKQSLASKKISIEIMTQEALSTHKLVTAMRTEAERINKSTNNSHKAQNRENRSKLAQRDRLREQKRLIAEYLPKSGWKFSDNSPVTYASILKLAEDFNKQRSLK